MVNGRQLDSISGNSCTPGVLCGMKQTQNFGQCEMRWLIEKAVRVELLAGMAVCLPFYIVIM